MQNKIVLIFNSAMPRHKKKVVPENVEATN